MRQPFDNNSPYPFNGGHPIHGARYGRWLDWYMAKFYYHPRAMNQ